MICAKFGWNWLSGCGEDFLNLLMYFRIVVIISPWKIGGAFIWTNLNSIQLKMICATLIEIGRLVLEKKIFFKFVNVFEQFCNFLPLKKGWPFIWTNLNPSLPKYVFCQVWLKLPQWFWRRWKKFRKMTTMTTTRTTDNGQILIRKAH